MNRIQVGPNRWIGEGEEPYVIAEIGINHNGRIDNQKLNLTILRWQIMNQTIRFI